MELDFGDYERQTAGIAALISLANDLATATKPSEIRATSAGAVAKQGRLRIPSMRLRQDQMTLNSFFLVLTTGLLAAFGFAFWIITAHLFSVSDVGKASALISATGLIGNLAILGLNNGMGRFLPESRNPDALISSGLALVAIFGAVGAVIYLLLIPFIAHDLTFVERSPALALSFALITSISSVNTLTDSIFVATRNAKYTVFVDGLVGGFGKLVFAFILTGAGAYGLFAASASGLVLAGLASVLLIYTVMHSRLDLRHPLKTLKPLFWFAGANYIGNVFNIIPGLAVPVILIDRLGAASAAYFFVVIQIVQIVYAAAFALEQTFLAEGSRSDIDLRELKRRSVRMLVMFCTPAALGIIAVGHWILLAFGRAYVNNGFVCLIILCIAVGPIAANYWYLTVLRLAGKLYAIVVVNVTYAAATCTFVWVGTSHGLTGVAAGWFLGALIATCVAVVSVRIGHPRHRESHVDLGMANDSDMSPRNGESPRRTQRPVNPFESRHGRAGPAMVNGRYPPCRNLESPWQKQRSAYPFQSGYDWVDPWADNGVYGTHENGQPYLAKRPIYPNGPGSEPVDPREANGRHSAQGNGARVSWTQTTVNPVDLDDDDDTSPPGRASI